MSICQHESEEIHNYGQLIDGESDCTILPMGILITVRHPPKTHGIDSDELRQSTPEALR